MRITFISQYFFPERFSNNAIVKELVERGHSVDVVCCVPNYGQEEFFEGYSNHERRKESWNGARVFRARTIARGRSSIRLALNFLWYPIAASWTIARQVKGRPDVSFVSMPSPIFQAFVGLFLRATRGTPCVYWVQDLWPESAIISLGLKKSIITITLNAVCGWLYRRADLVLIQSEAFRESLERQGVSPERISFLPNTAPAMYQPVDPVAETESRVRVPDGEFRIMFAGNIGESQDFDTLLATASILRERKGLVWIVVGSGRDEARVRRQVEILGLSEKFIFLGPHPEELMPSIFSHADAMLVSLKDTQIFRLTVPYKIQCYMACGKPVIASLSGEGARLVIESEAGFVAPASQPEKLANQIEKFLDLSEDTKREMGLNARTFFEQNYGQNVVYDRLEALLGDAAKGASCS